METQNNGMDIPHSYDASVNSHINSSVSSPSSSPGSQQGHRRRLSEGSSLRNHQQRAGTTPQLSPAVYQMQSASESHHSQFPISAPNPPFMDNRQFTYPPPQFPPSNLVPVNGPMYAQYPRPNLQFLPPNLYPVQFQQDNHRPVLIPQNYQYQQQQPPVPQQNFQPYYPQQQYQGQLPPHQFQQVPQSYYQQPQLAPRPPPPYQYSAHTQIPSFPIYHVPDSDPNKPPTLKRIPSTPVLPTTDQSPVPISKNLPCVSSTPPVSPPPTHMSLPDSHSAHIDHVPDVTVSLVEEGRSSNDTLVSTDGSVSSKPASVSIKSNRARLDSNASMRSIDSKEFQRKSRESSRSDAPTESNSMSSPILNGAVGLASSPKQLHLSPTPPPQDLPRTNSPLVQRSPSLQNLDVPSRTPSPGRLVPLRDQSSGISPAQRKARESLIPSVMFDSATKAKFERYMANGGRDRSSRYVSSNLARRSSRDSNISYEEDEDGVPEPSRLSSASSISESDGSISMENTGTTLAERIEIAKNKTRRINPGNVQVSLSAARFIIENVQYCEPSQQKQLTEIGIRGLKKLSVTYQMPEAQFALAHLYVSGIPGFGKKHVPDFGKAYTLFSSASKKDHADAQFYVALCYEIGAGVGISSNKALQHYRKAAISNHPGAMYRLGMALLYGELGQSKNPRDGVKWLKLSAKYADEKYPFGLYELAMLHDTGVHNYIWRDYEFLVNKLIQTAALGYAQAQFKLGEAYEYGNFGVSVDPQKAVYYYSLAAQSNHLEAMFELGGMYLTGAEDPKTGFILPQSDDTAFAWVKKAADGELPKALFAMGYFLETGIGVPSKDENGALVWYQKAAELGDSKAGRKLKEKGIKFKRNKPRSNSNAVSTASTGNHTELTNLAMKKENMPTATLKLFNAFVKPPPAQQSAFAFGYNDVDFTNDGNEGVQVDRSRSSSSLSQQHHITSQVSSSSLSSIATAVNNNKQERNNDNTEMKQRRRQSMAANRMSLYNPAMSNRASVYMQPTEDAETAFRELQQLKKLQLNSEDEEDIEPVPDLPTPEPETPDTPADPNQPRSENIVLVIPAAEGQLTPDGQPAAAQYVTIDISIIKQLSEREGQQILQIPGQNPEDPPTYVYINPADFVGLFQKEAPTPPPKSELFEVEKSDLEAIEEAHVYEEGKKEILFVKKSGENLKQFLTATRIPKPDMESIPEEQFSTMIRVPRETQEETESSTSKEIINNSSEEVNNSHEQNITTPKEINHSKEDDAVSLNDTASVTSEARASVSQDGGDDGTVKRTKLKATPSFRSIRQKKSTRSLKEKKQKEGEHEKDCKVM